MSFWTQQGEESSNSSVNWVTSFRGRERPSESPRPVGLVGLKNFLFLIELEYSSVIL